MHSFSKAQRGFTLIEIMFAITIFAILMAVAVPSFLETVRNNRLVTQNNEFISALNIARSEALKRSSPVSICSSADQTACSGSLDWTTGYIVFDDPNSNGQADVGETVLQAWGAAPPEFTLTATNRNFVRFVGSGTANAGAEVFDLVRTGCVGNKARRINISFVGRVSTATVACP